MYWGELCLSSPDEEWELNLKREDRIKERSVKPFGWCEFDEDKNTLERGLEAVVQAIRN